MRECHACLEIGFQTISLSAAVRPFLACLQVSPSHFGPFQSLCQCLLLALSEIETVHFEVCAEGTLGRGTRTSLPTAGSALFGDPSLAVAHEHPRWACPPSPAPAAQGQREVVLGPARGQEQVRHTPYLEIDFQAISLSPALSCISSLFTSCFYSPLAPFGPFVEVSYLHFPR